MTCVICAAKLILSSTLSRSNIVAIPSSISSLSCLLQFSALRCQGNPRSSFTSRSVGFLFQTTDPVTVFGLSPRFHRLTYYCPIGEKARDISAFWHFSPKSCSNFPKLVCLTGNFLILHLQLVINNMFCCDGDIGLLLCVIPPQTVPSSLSCNQDAAFHSGLYT